MNILNIKEKTFNGDPVTITERLLALGCYRLEWEHQGNHYRIYSYEIERGWAEVDLAEDLAEADDEDGDGVFNDPYYQSSVVRMEVIQ